jgi:hypothetical protein
MYHASQVLVGLGFPICTECVATGPEDLYVNEQGQGIFLAKRTFSLSVENEPLRKVLDRLVEVDPDYRWELLEGAPLVNIIPKQSTLTWSLTNVNLVNATLLDALTTRPIRDHNIGLWVRGPNVPRQAIAQRVTLAAREIEFREFLNRIVAQHQRMVWVLDGHRILRVDWAPQRDVGALEASREFDVGRRLASAPPVVADLKRPGRAELPDRASAEAKRLRHTEYHVIAKSMDNLKEPERSLKLAYLDLLVAMLDKDLGQLMSHIHPKGIRDGSQLHSHKDVEEAFHKKLSHREYSRFTLGEVLDFERLQVRELKQGRFLVTAPTKIKYVGREMYFDDSLALVFERGADGRWFVVEMD